MNERIVLAVLLLAGSASAQELWGDLEPGPYGVGFRSAWTLDPARNYDTTFADGSRYAPDEPAPRPILVNVWYPTALPSELEPMPHGGYLEILSDDPGLAQLSVELADYARGVIAEYTLDHPLDQLDERQIEQLEAFFATPTACRRDATPAQGPFPLVLQHSGYGSSFEDNSVLCEYLASHGYVVVGSAFQSEAGGSFNIDGKDGSERDLAFLIRHLQASPEVDLGRIGAVGHSGGAHAVLGFQARPMSALDAVVSLDTTQDYVSALDPHWAHSKKVLANIEGQTAPLLVVANPQAFFQLCDALVRAERTYLTFRDLDHNDFTSQGVFRAENRAELARTDGLVSTARAVRKGYEECCEYVRAFFDASLRGDGEERARLDALYTQTPLGTEAAHVERVPVGQAGPAPFDAEAGDQTPPTPRQLRRLLDDVGAERTLELLVRFHESHPEAPIFHDQLALHVLLDLVARGREEEAAVLAPFFAQLHPGLTGTLSWWIGRSGDERYRDYRRQAWTTLLLLDPDNAEAAAKLARERR